MQIQDSSDLNQAGVYTKDNDVFSGVESLILRLALRKETEIMQMLDEMAHMPDVDGRALAVARTQIQTGFMWMFRAITIPTV